MNLPEKLRNLGIQPAPKGKIRVELTDHQIYALADVVIPAEKIKGA